MIYRVLEEGADSLVVICTDANTHEDFPRLILKYSQLLALLPPDALIDTPKGSSSRLSSRTSGRSPAVMGRSLSSRKQDKLSSEQLEQQKQEAQIAIEKADKKIASAMSNYILNRLQLESKALPATVEENVEAPEAESTTGSTSIPAKKLDDAQSLDRAISAAEKLQNPSHTGARVVLLRLHADTWETLEHKPPISLDHLEGPEKFARTSQVERKSIIEDLVGETSALRRQTAKAQDLVKDCKMAVQFLEQLSTRAHEKEENPIKARFKRAVRRVILKMRVRYCEKMLKEKGIKYISVNNHGADPL